MTLTNNLASFNSFNDPLHPTPQVLGREHLPPPFPGADAPGLPYFALLTFKTCQPSHYRMPQAPFPRPGAYRTVYTP